MHRCSLQQKENKKPPRLAVLNICAPTSLPLRSTGLISPRTLVFILLRSKNTKTTQHPSLQFPEVLLQRVSSCTTAPVQPGTPVPNVRGPERGHPARALSRLKGLMASGTSLSLPLAGLESCSEVGIASGQHNLAAFPEHGPEFGTL